MLSTMVCVALSSLLVLILTQTLGQGSKGANNIHSLIESDQFRASLIQIMRDQAFCKKAFMGKEFDLSSSNPSDLAVSNISLSLPSDSSRVLAAAGTHITPQLEVKSVALKQLAPITTGGDNFIGALEFNLGFNSPAYGGNNLTRKIDLYLETRLVAPPSTRRSIVSCSAGDPATIAVTLPSRLHFTHFQIYPASGTFSVPSETTQLMAEVWGGGGGGGSAYKTATQCAGGGGGGAGGYGMGIFSVNPGDVIPVSVGIGGQMGAYPINPPPVLFPSPSPGDGGNGTQSSFGNLLTSTGGGGGFRGRPDVPNGQTGFGGSSGTSNGQEQEVGGPGQPGDYSYNSPVGAIGGMGGAAFRSGVAGTGPGGGGTGGACAVNNTPEGNGYAGAPGRVIVWW